MSVENNYDKLYSDFEKVCSYNENLREENKRYRKALDDCISASPLSSVSGPIEREGWVRVEDGLPEKRPGWSHSEDVNIFIKHELGGFVGTGSYDHLKNKWADYLYDNKYNQDITHWMQLPKPPIK